MVRSGELFEILNISYAYNVRTFKYKLTLSQRTSSIDFESEKHLHLDLDFFFVSIQPNQMFTIVILRTHTFTHYYIW